MSNSVLLVDDERAILRAWVRLFRNEGYRLLTASSGKDALKFFDNGPIAVVLADFRMPEMNGGQLAEAISQRSPATVCILISGYAELGQALEALNQGYVHRFLTKPWRDDVLRNEIRQGVALYAKKCHWLQLFGGPHGRELNAILQDLDKKLDIQRDNFSSQLAQAIATGQLYLMYQPKVNWRNREIRSAEVLARWYHPLHGHIPPTQFIPLAESCGLIRMIGEWVLDEACRQFRLWLSVESADTMVPERLAINVSAIQLQQRDLPDQFLLIVQRHAILPEQIELEVTESCIISDMELAIEIMQRLRALGFQLHLDDFGTGYNSLHLLQQLPVTTLKIPREFMKSLTDDATTRSCVEYIIGLAQSLDLDIVAEGVEFQQQVGVLTQLGCDTMQGYLFSPPLLPENFYQLMQSADQTLPRLGN